MHLIVFRNRKRDDFDADAYAADATRMEELARRQPGFLSVKSYRSDDNEVVTISEWATAQDAESWGHHPEHREVQQRGIREYYASYTLLSCPEPSAREFVREA